MTPKPTPLAVHVAGIPDVLKAQPRWVCWRYEWRDDKWAKMQRQPSGDGAKSNDATTWVAFTEALEAYQRGGFDGVSFALGDGWAGIDADNYLCQPPDAWPLLRIAGGYRERSPGGTGIKIIGRSPRIGGEMKFDPVAVAYPTSTTWTGVRFFTITGQDSSGDPTADISTFIDARFPAPAVVLSTRTGYAEAATKDDDHLLMWMISADKVGDKILALWRGDLSAYGGDHSRADQALCCHLAFWTNYDVERMDRMFRQSGLMRPKWNSDSYRRATLGKAVQ